MNMLHVKTSLLALFCIAQLPCHFNMIKAAGEKTTDGQNTVAFGIGLAAITGVGYLIYNNYFSTPAVTEKKSDKQTTNNRQATATPKAVITPAAPTIPVKPATSVATKQEPTAASVTATNAGLAKVLEDLSKQQEYGLKKHIIQPAGKKSSSNQELTGPKVPFEN